MALSASLIARCAIAISQEVTGPVLPEASTALKAITSQSVMALARAEVGKAAPHAMTNRNSAAIARMDRRFEPEFIIPPIQCLFAQATVPNIHTCQATFIPCYIPATSERVRNLEVDLIQANELTLWTRKERRNVC